MVMDNSEMLTRIGTLIAAMVLVSVTSGCGDTMTDQPAKPVEATAEQALERSQAYARESLSLWGPGARLTPIDGQASKLWCSDLSDPPPGTPVHLSAVYELSGYAAPDPASAIDDFVTFWEDRGWKVTRQDASTIAVARDGYVLDLTVDRKITVGLDTPCVSGTTGSVGIEPLTPASASTS